MKKGIFLRGKFMENYAKFCSENFNRFFIRHATSISVNDNVACASSSTVVWSVWRRSPTCWSRRTGISSTWPSWTTTSTRRSPSWRPRSSASTRHPNGYPSLGSTDSGLHRFVISSPRTAMAHRGWNSDRWCHDDHRTTVDPLVAKIWQIAIRNTPQAATPPCT